MKLLKTDRQEGYARIEIENRDDLWYLKNIISEGDRLRTLTQRTKIDSREKKTLKLTLEAEKVNYEKERLRVTGEIEKAGDEVELGYHTFNLEEGDEFEIWKDFTEEEWNQLEEAESKHSYEVLFCLVEKGKADLYLVEESGITDLSKLQENIPGKLYSDQKTGEGFHKEVKDVLERSSDADNIILCGPGFEKDKVYNLLSDELKEKTLVQDTSVTGRTGLNEAIKRGALKRVVEESRIGEEAKIVEEFLEALETDDGLATYGEPVKDLAEKGAVERLIVTDEKFREDQDLVKNVEQQGGKVSVVHTDHEAGERLENFGGIAAFLRYNPN